MAYVCFFFQAEDGIRDGRVTGVQTCALPIYRQNAESLLVSHIRTVVRHFSGHLHSWDVVNEALHPADGAPGGLRRSQWYELLGADYVSTAFHVAAEEDSRALL